jgi:hypothetical protein
MFNRKKLKEQQSRIKDLEILLQQRDYEISQLNLWKTKYEISNNTIMANNTKLMNELHSVTKHLKPQPKQHTLYTIPNVGQFVFIEWEHEISENLLRQRRQ